jgi:hypothetical protein
VGHRRLAVGHRGARLDQAVARLAAELHRDHRVVRAVADRHRQPVGLAEVELEALDLRDEPAQRHDPGRTRPPGAEAERVRHDRPLREPAEHGPVVGDAVLGQDGVEPGGDLRVGRVEGLGIGVADAPHRVPVRAAGRQRERPAGGRADQPALGIEQVEQRQEVVLVGAAAVEEHERAVWPAFGGAEQVF